MQSVVFVGRMVEGTAPEIAALFAKFDASDLPIRANVRRRQMYTYYDLHINVLDFHGEPDAEKIEALKAGPQVAEHQRKLDELVSPLRPESWRSVADTAAMPFYLWRQDGWLPATDASHSTIVVNRMDSSSIPKVSALFAELDATDFPSRMGTRRRQLFTHHDVYFHLQDFPDVDGKAVIAGAWKERDPRFIRICEELDPFMTVYDPATWRSTADQVATPFYHWEPTV